MQFDLNAPWKDLEAMATAQPMMPKIQQPNIEGAPAPLSVPNRPGMVEQVATKAGMAGAKEMAQGIGEAYKNPSAAQMAGVLGEGASSGAGSQAEMLAKQMEGFGQEGVAKTAEAAGTSAPGMFGPLASAIPGLLKGDVKEAATDTAIIAAGTAALTPVAGPFAPFLASGLKSIFGFENGTTSVPASTPNMGVDTISPPGKGVQNATPLAGQPAGKGTTTMQPMTQQQQLQAPAGGATGKGVSPTSNPNMSYRNSLAAGFTQGGSEGLVDNVFYKPSGFATTPQQQVAQPTTPANGQGTNTSTGVNWADGYGEGQGASSDDGGGPDGDGTGSDGPGGVGNGAGGDPGADAADAGR